MCDSTLNRAHVRIKLFFTQALGHKVYKDRGVSKCWYLVPTSCKQIADVMYHICEAFDLMTFCPNGIHLLIDDVNVLPGEDVRILRENDAVAVEGLDFERYDNEVSSDTAVQSSRPKRSHTSSSTDKKSKKKERKKDRNKKLVLAAKRLPEDKVERNQDKRTKILERKKSQQPAVAVVATGMQRFERSLGPNTFVQERSESRFAFEPDQNIVEENLSKNKKGRKRPSRRQRQAKRRRLELENSYASTAVPIISLIPQENDQQSTKTAENLEQRRVIPAAEAADTKKTECQSPIQVEAREKQTSTNRIIFESDDTEVDRDTIFEERPQWSEWKRPYEVIASVADEANQHLSTETDHGILATALLEYPISLEPHSITTYKVNDILAYQTLTLCSETWQPVQSDWQCGRVCSIEENDCTIRLETHTLTFFDNTLQWNTEHDTNELALSEIHQLHFLQGPSYVIAQAVESTS